MRNILVMSLFMLATLAWAAAQQPGSTSAGSSGQATSPGSQTPGASQSQPSTPGSAGESGQSGMPGGSQSQMAAPPVTEGCLGGSNPNYTVTSSAGTTYKLNIPPNANASQLASHIGESVNVAGNVNNTGNSPSIDVRGIGRGTGTCPGGSSKGAQPPQ